MRRATLPLLILACVAVAVALTWFTLSRGGGGGGEVTTEVRTVAPFKALDVAGNAEVTLVQGKDESVKVEIEARAQPRVRARVENGTLVITGGDTRRWWNSIFGGGRGSVRPRVTVTFKTLDAIALAGSVKLTAARIDTPLLRIAASGGTLVRIDDLQAQQLKLSGAGALKATLAGRVVDQSISISGAAEVHADRLASDNASVSVSGAGSVVINAAKTLKASISGAGIVEYYGDPTVKQSVSGVGRVKRRETARMDGIRVAAPVSHSRHWSFDAGHASALNSSGPRVTGSRSA